MTIQAFNSTIPQAESEKKPASAAFYAAGSAIVKVTSSSARILGNIPLTIVKNALPDVYERLLLGSTLSFGKEAILKGGSKCILLTALQGLFGNIDTRYETYWKSKTWNDLLSSDYLKSIYQNASRVVSEPKETGPILNKLSSFVSNAVGNLFSDPSSYCTEDLCPNNSNSVKIAAFFTALYVVFASVRITHAVATSVVSDIRETCFPTQPSIQKRDLDLEQEVKALGLELSKIKNFKQELLEELSANAELDDFEEIDDCEELDDEGIDDCDEVDNEDFEDDIESSIITSPSTPIVI